MICLNNTLFKFFILSLIVVFAYFININIAQLSKFVPPDSSYTPCPYGSLTKNLSYCPPETLCMNWQYPPRTNSPLTEEEEIRFSAISSPGCCPIDSPRPCFTGSGIAALSGCCPQGKHCCSDPEDNFRLIGCATSASQCCGNSICPEGFSCCFTDEKRGGYCCPGFNGCNPILNETALAENNNTLAIYKFVPNPYLAGTSAIFDTRVYSNCSKVNADSTERVPFFINGTSGEAFPCGINKSWCRGESYIDPSDNTTLGIADNCFDVFGDVIDPDNQTLIEEEGEFCCPALESPCIMGAGSRSFISNFTAPTQNGVLRQPQLLGCISEERNETCCSTSICSSGNKCCSFELPPSWDSSEEQNVNQVQGTNATYDIDICCPEGTWCCAKIIPISNSGSGYFKPNGVGEVTDARFENAYIHTFCGRNANCTSSAFISEMFQLAPSVSKFGFLPDYIQDVGWLPNPLEYFSSQLKSEKSSVNINPNCLIYSGDSESNYDFCGLKSTQNDVCQLGN